MELTGNVNIFEHVDPVTKLSIRFAEFDSALTIKLLGLQAAAQFDPSLKRHLDGFNNSVLDRMDFPPREGIEPPLYYWVRSTKRINRLSFEDGVYNIPAGLASAIVRASDAALFIRLLGG